MLQETFDKGGILKKVQEHDLNLIGSLNNPNLV